MFYKDYELNFNNEVSIRANDILSIKGLADISASYKTLDNAVGDGEIIVGRTVNSRSPKIKFRVSSILSDTMVRYFRPHSNHVLYIDTRKINCNIKSAELTWDDGYANDPAVELTLFCPDPYFYDISDFGQNIAGIQPMFGFPWTATIDDGITFGYRIFSDSTIFRNAGDKPVGFKAVLTAARGTATNVKFENLITGEYLRVVVSLDQGDYVEISTVQSTGEQYIRKNGVDIFADIDRLSDFFLLARGDNFLKYSADTGVTNLDVVLYYTPVYGNGMVVDKEES